jgi:acetyl esterase/lipase
MKNQFSEVHPELQQFVKRMPRITFSNRNLWFWRFLDNVLWRRKIPEDISIENICIPSQETGMNLRLRIYRSKSLNASAPVLVWLHGGGYIVGKPEQDDFCCIQYVREAGIVVVSVDYRYAPEHPFPAALEDGYSALIWVKSHAEQLSIDSTRIAIGGASAGAGLAAALIQLANDRNEIKPSFQLLVYPMLDDRTSLRTDIVNHRNMIWSQDSNRFGWKSYLGKECGAKDVPAYSVPGRREDLSGLPPAWIGVGTLDLFHDEDVEYAQKLSSCGVECEIFIIPGAFHGFDVFDPQIPIIQDFRKSQISAMKKYLFP